MTGAYATPVSRAWWRAELALAAGMLVVTWAGLFSELRYSPNPTPAPAAGYTLVLLACAVLPLRRRYPWLVAAVVVGLCYAYHLLGYPGLSIALTAFVAVYSLAAYQAWPGLVGCALVIVAIWIVPTIGPNPLPWYSFAISAPALGLSSFAVLGAAARQRRLAADERLRAAVRAADAELAQRLAEERLRIARELHDVLAHTVSVISVQAGVALDTLTADPESARSALQLVRAAARQAGPELRAALGPLRTSSSASASSGAAPAPGLDSLESLLSPVRAAGLTVHCELSPGVVTHPVELTAYRIVQESLTNVVRHAHARTVWVCVERDDATLRVAVRDDGTARPVTNPGGFGITGMRERAQLLGGSLSAGPLPGGGFGVRADLPILP